MEEQNMMNEGVSKINLTETPPCPRQKQEGKNSEVVDMDDRYEEMRNEYEAFLRAEFPYHLEYLTMKELIEYEYLRQWLKSNKNYSYEKHLNEERYNQLTGKLDISYLVRKTEEDFQIKKHQKILEKKLKNKANNRYELGAREFTFTYSPKWYDDAEARLRMSSAIQKICKYYKDDILQLRAVGETGTNGLAHIHCFYRLRGGLKITDKNFKRAYPMWDTKVKQGPTGHKGGHHATVRNDSDFQGYIDKDIETCWFEVNIDNSADPTN